jgi:hypothetical protein
MYAEATDFIWKHANWLIGLLCFYLSYGGIVRREMSCGPLYPWSYLWPRKYLYGSQAAGFGFLYLVVGFVAIFNLWYGSIGLVITSLTSDLVGLSRPPE